MGSPGPSAVGVQAPPILPFRVPLYPSSQALLSPSATATLSSSRIRAHQQLLVVCFCVAGHTLFPLNTGEGTTCDIP